MENHLKRLLKPYEVVHHKNRNKHDNAIKNLEVLTKSVHIQQHGLQVKKKIAKCKCPECGVVFLRAYNQTHLIKKTKYNFVCCSRSCSGKFKRKIQLHGLTAEMKDTVSVNIQRVYYGKLPDNTEETSNKRFRRD